MSRSDSHVREEDLVALATSTELATSLAGEVLDSAMLGHLASCGDCAARLDGMQRLLGGLRADGVAAADEVFDADRLDRQREHILRRVEHAGRPARVIEFPPQRSGRTTRRAQPMATRWIAAAAAAGLFVGVAAGRLSDAFLQQGAEHTRMARITPLEGPPSLMVPPPRDAKPAGADEEILSDVEAALMTQRAPALEAIDALTPRLRDVGLKIR